MNRWIECQEIIEAVFDQNYGQCFQFNLTNEKQVLSGAGLSFNVDNHGNQGWPDITSHHHGIHVCSFYNCYYFLIKN